ncbi:MAG: hypothetical protein KGJ02_08675 [Verrucomicrobiota bacterium]|nr:hypothetical protein [Verrucomicrobiota bacterium]
MCYSTFLAQVIGLYLFLMSISMLLNQERYKKLCGSFLNDHPLMMVSGAVGLILGLLVVVTHNVWVSDWPLLITLIGWVVLLQGMMKLCFVDAYTRLVKNMDSRFGCVLVSWIWLLVGVYLIYVGFYQ